MAAAKTKVEAAEQDILDLEGELAAEIRVLTERFDPQALELETEILKPTRANVEVDEVALLWLPFDEQGGKAW